MQLNEKHYKCIELLLKGYSYTDIAEMIPCSRQSIYDWLKDTTFKAELDNSRQEIKNRNKNRVVGKSDIYLDKIEHIAFNSPSDNVKLKALAFLWEAGNGKATTKVEQSTSNDNKTNEDISIDDLLAEIEEDNNVKLDD